MDLLLIRHGGREAELPAERLAGLGVTLIEGAAPTGVEG